MKINQIVSESTTAGSIASVAQPLGGMQKRSGNKKAGSMFKGKTTNKPFYEDQVNEEDKIITPGKGNKFKPGLLNKPENSMNPADNIKLDVPLLIRLLEFAREDASSDLDLHDLAEKLVARGTRGKTLTMKDYEYVVDECMQNGGVIAAGGIGEGYDDNREYGGAYVNGQSDDAKLTARLTRLAKAAAKKAGKTFNTSAEYRKWYQKQIGEGVVDTINRGVKNVRRGMQGWGKTHSDGVKYGEGEFSPKNIVKRNKNFPDEKLAGIHRSFDRTKVADHGPAGLQKRVLDREMKKRGLAQEGEKVDRMVKHIAKSERGLGHSKKEAENIAWATVNKKGMLDNKNKK